VVGHLALQPETAKRSVSEIEVDLLAQAPLGADAGAVADQQHADHQFGINGGSAGGTVVAGQVLAQPRTVDEAVDAPQEVSGGM
jgi:uncharacterized Ntn-hydrolase superfamily protein